MKKAVIQTSILIGMFIITVSGSLFAGNEQRAGQAGADELLINPWAASTGIGGANSASIKGIDAFYTNIAGTAFTKRTELYFTHTLWLEGIGVHINAAGFSQKVGETGVLSMSFMSMGFGDIEITTVDLPEGGLGTYKINYTNIGLAYSKAFSNSIYGGMVVKVINQGISDLNASGVSLDAGIQYVTGVGKDKSGNRYHDNLKFGISMKNVGPTMKYTGDGMSFRGIVPAGDDVSMTVEQRSTAFELPALIKIGVTYDYYIGESLDTINDKVVANHRISPSVNFTSNSFTKDMYHAGVEYAYKDMLIIRAGYIYQTKIDETDKPMTNLTGLSTGFSIMLPLNKEKGSKFVLDYSYRDTDPFNGIHSIGARIIL
ncbi:MAG: hypothetical protein Kow0068_08770 [Marinilabiliales bacterium]